MMPTSHTYGIILASVVTLRAIPFKASWQCLPPHSLPHRNTVHCPKTQYGGGTHALAPLMVVGGPDAVYNGIVPVQHQKIALCDGRPRVCPLLRSSVPRCPVWGVKGEGGGGGPEVTKALSTP